MISISSGPHCCEGVFITHLDEHHTAQTELAFSLPGLVKQYQQYSEGFKNNSVQFPAELESMNIFSSSLSPTPSLPSLRLSV